MSPYGMCMTASSGLLRFGNCHWSQVKSSLCPGRSMAATEKQVRSKKARAPSSADDPDPDPDPSRSCTLCSVCVCLSDTANHTTRDHVASGAVTVAEFVFVGPEF